MILFLCSSYYTEENLIPHLTGLFVEPIEKVFLFRDNLPVDDADIFNYSFVHYTNDIKEIVQESDLVVLIDDGHVSTRFLDLVREECKKQRVIVIDLKYEDNDTINTNLSRRIEDNFCKPVVLLCYDGHSSQVEDLELSLYEEFQNNNISFKQLFSPFVVTVLTGIKSFIKESYIENMNKSIDDGQLFIVSLPFDALLFRCVDAYRVMSLLNPDYLIFCGDNNKFKTNEIDNLFKYKFNTKVDVFTHSSYYSYRELSETEKRIRITKKSIVIEDRRVMLYNENAKRVIFDSIINKLTKPKGIEFIDN